MFDGGVFDSLHQRKAAKKHIKKKIKISTKEIIILI